MESFQGEMKTPAEDCLEQTAQICLECSVQRLASSSGPQIHQLQCEYVVGKLKTAVECVQEYFKYLAVEEIQNYHCICKLLLQAAMDAITIVTDCCKSRWILAAVLLADPTHQFTSLAYELEMCTRLMHNSWRRVGVLQTLRELRDVKNVETNRFIDMVVRDRKALLEKLAGQVQSCIKERNLADHLMKRMQNVVTMTYGHVDVKCWQLLDSKCLERLGSLGKGVDKVKWFGEHFALKTFFGSEHQTFMNEMSILAGLSHPNIVSLVGFVINTRNRSSSILLELMDQDLYHYMQEKLANDDSTEVPFSHIEAIDIMLQIAEGVQYLHDNKIVHRDLKSFNIMINRVKRQGGHEHLQVKVVDFGLSKVKENSHTYSNQTPNIGTTRWMAPELFKPTNQSLESVAMASSMMEVREEAKHPFKTDVYSFAMVCIEILTGDVPFSTNISLGGLRESILDGLRPELPWNQWPERLCVLIEKCWVFDPIDRPSFATIVSELKCIKCSLVLVIHKGPSSMLGWNLLANRLERLESLQNLLAPTNILVGLMGEIARLTYSMLEVNRASKENQVLVEQLSECTYALFRKLEWYIIEPWTGPKEKLFPKFLYNFQETMENVLGFVRKFSVPQYIILHIDVKSQFTNLRQHLDVVEVDFKFRMLRNLFSKYKPIGHWRLGGMWKPGLGNVIEANWAQFWDQMMLDFPGTSQFLLGPSAAENKAKLEAKAIACMFNTSPRDIENNNICSCASIEEILINLLVANEHDPDHPVVIALEASKEQHQINASTANVAKEVICWNGYFMNSSGTKGDMKAELFITAVHNIYGGGSDDIGDFTWTGCCQDTRANIIKHYIDQHKLKYDGVMEDTSITGIWRFLFSHSMGEFFLEPQPYKSNGRVAQFVDAGKIKHWDGYFREDDKISDMSAQIIFTENGSIYSTGGKDNMGSFNLLGRYYPEYHSVSLYMVKQPRAGMPAVYYWGVMAKEESSSDVVIEGSWVYWNQMGTFRLVAEAFP